MLLKGPSLGIDSTLRWSKSRVHPESVGLLLSPVQIELLFLFSFFCSLFVGLLSLSRWAFSFGQVRAPVITSPFYGPARLIFFLGQMWLRLTT